MTTTIDPAELDRLHQQHAHEGVNAVASAFARYIHSKLDQPTNNAILRSLEQLIEVKLIDRVGKEGDRIPDFELPNGGGKSVRLSEVLRDGLVVLVFYRGAWCHYCILHLTALQTRLDEIERYGARLVAVSPQTSDRSHSVVEENKLQFPVLSDVGNHVARALGLVFDFPVELKTAHKRLGIDLNDFNGDESWTLPIPGTFIINRDRTIAKVWADVDYRRRAEPDDVVNALRTFSEKCESNESLC